MEGKFGMHKHPWRWKIWPRPRCNLWHLTSWGTTQWNHPVLAVTSADNSIFPDRMTVMFCSPAWSCIWSHLSVCRQYKHVHFHRNNQCLLQEKTQLQRQLVHTSSLSTSVHCMPWTLGRTRRTQQENHDPKIVLNQLSVFEAGRKGHHNDPLNTHRQFCHISRFGLSRGMHVTPHYLERPRKRPWQVKNQLKKVSNVLPILSQPSSSMSFEAVGLLRYPFATPGPLTQISPLSWGPTGFLVLRSTICKSTSFQMNEWPTLQCHWGKYLVLDFFGGEGETCLATEISIIFLNLPWSERCWSRVLPTLDRSCLHHQW